MRIYNIVICLILFLAIASFAKAIPLEKAVAAPSTDVAVTNISIFPEEPELGDEVEATIIIQNLGDITTNITTHGGFSTPSYGGGGGSCPYCIELEAGEILIHTMRFTVTEEGEYKIWESVDSQIFDTNPLNDFLSLSFIVE